MSGAGGPGGGRANPRPGPGLESIRIGAVGDLHHDGGERGLMEEIAREARERADILALLGDLTTHGLPDQARGVAEVFGSLRMPVVAVLGNHDYESDRAPEVTEILCRAGLRVLDGGPVEIDGVGFAGVKGFAGGFGRGSLGSFGEPLVKAWVQEAMNEALKLENALRKMDSPVKIALLHYAPIPDTLHGEPEIIYPYLGSSRLLPPLEELRPDAVFHGHAHTGVLEGQTPGGVRVYNVSLPLLQTLGRERVFVWTPDRDPDAARDASEAGSGGGRALRLPG